MKEIQKHMQKEPIFEEEESQKESSFSSDLFFPDSDDTQNTGKNTTKTKQIKKNQQKGPSRNIGRGERKDKNTFPNTLKKIYRASLKTLGFARIIQAGRLGSDVTLVFDKKEQTIQVALPKKCAKNQMLKFLVLIAKKLDEAERSKARETFITAVEKSIQLQQNKMKKRQEYREACEQSITTLLLIGELINYFLRSSAVTLDSELNSRVYCKESKKERYNNGVKSIQRVKQELLLKELQKINRESNFDNEDYFDVLDFEGHRYDRCSFEE